MAQPLRSADILATFHEDLARLRRTWLEPWRAQAPGPALTQRPAPKSWSAIECLQHVVIVNDAYVTHLEEAIDLATRKGRRATESFQPGFLGDWMDRSMRPRKETEPDGHPKLGTKLKAPGSTKPEALVEQPNVQDTLARFDQQLGRYEDLAKRLEPIDLHTRSRTLFPILKLRVGDIVRFLMAHADRHHVQANRATASAG